MFSRDKGPPASAATVTTEQASVQDQAAAPDAAADPATQGGPPATADGPSHETQPSAGSTKLSFRSILRDDDRNQVLHAGESYTVELDVRNDGDSPAQGVEVHLSGTPALLEHLSRAVPVGDLEPGEWKRLSVTGTVGPVKDVAQAELVLTLRSVTPAELPAAKKFLVAVRPDPGEELEVLSVDVDQVPKSANGLKQPKAAAVVIGVGSYRDDKAPAVKYADRDAQVMADYLKRVSGIPPARVKMLTEAHALKDDVAEAIEEWLPKQVEPGGVVYVYFAGRALVDGVSGGVSLVPYDGVPSGATRLFPARRLEEILMRLPVQRAIVMMEVSLDPLPVAGGAGSTVPVWETAEGHNKILWMVGNRKLQDAHAFDQGRHGLFTYYLLKGLSGAADADRDGTILAGELCTYAKGQVVTIARQQFSNEQEPMCIPGPGHGATARIQPVAKVKQAARVH